MCLHKSIVYLDKLNSIPKNTIANLRKTQLLIIVSSLKLFLFNVLIASFYDVEPLILHNMFLLQVLICLKSFTIFKYINQTIKNNILCKNSIKYKD